MQNKPRWYDAITINIYYLGISMLTQTVSTLVLPLLIQQFIGERSQGTYFGIIRLWGLMVALLVQALSGMLSDHATSRWGRRRPFILAGTLLELVFIAAMAFSSILEGIRGFWILFASYLLLQASSNLAHGAMQGLIPDLIPEAQRGRFSGIKAFFEVPLPVILIAFTVSHIIEAGQLVDGLALTASILVATMLITLLVQEKPCQEPASPLNLISFLRLLLMTAAFTAIILGAGAGVKQVSAWIKNMPSAPLQFLIMGATGLLAMGIAIAAGVWISIRISIGKENTQQQRSFIWWIINRLTFLVGAFNLSSFLLFFIQARLGFTNESAVAPTSNVIMLVGISLLLSALPSGWLSDKFGQKRTAMLSGIVAGTGILLLIIAPSMTAIYIGACLIGLATGTFYTANWALGTCLVPKEEAGRYLGLSNLAGAGAGAIGAYIGGPIADHFTTYIPEVPGLGYTLIFALYGALFLLSSIALLKIKEPQNAKAHLQICPQST